MPDLSETLQAAVLATAAELRDRFRDELRDRKACKKLSQIIYNAIYERRPPGRPQKEQIDQAEELLRAGVEWRDIYRVVIPNYANLLPAERRIAQATVRQGTYQRKYEAKKKSKALNEPSNAPTIAT